MTKNCGVLGISKLQVLFTLGSECDNEFIKYVNKKVQF